MLVLNALLKGRKSNQAYFLEEVPLSLSGHRKLNYRRNVAFDCVVHMDNYNARTIVEKLRHNKIQPAPHPVHSPDLSPCDFWLFGLLKKTQETGIIDGRTNC
jgi:hypothetical protein